MKMDLCRVNKLTTGHRSRTRYQFPYLKLAAKNCDGGDHCGRNGNVTRNLIEFFAFNTKLPTMANQRILQQQEVTSSGA